MNIQQNIPSIKSKISQLIGNTPLLALPTRNKNARILLKMEQFNPTGTAKVRMARQMIEEAEAEGKLKPGGWIVESTSGNTGLGLALIAAERGYRFTAVVDKHASADKLYAMQALGAELHYVGNDDGLIATADRDLAAENISKEHGAYWTEQHNNPANANAYSQLADELTYILQDNIHYLFGAVGTGGSLCGTARALKRTIPQLNVIGVEPEGSIIFGGQGSHYFQSGTGTPADAEIGDLVDYEIIDRGLKVTDTQAFETARYLAKNYGIFIGGSAGGVIYQALQTSKTVDQATTIVILICDGGEKYIHTVFNDHWMQANNLTNQAVIEDLKQILN
ncbi:PLP-dependent cysteine synthase family protein [Acinetobacter stercoris]|uniref:cysteine synthase n=1 Tax=Acinetobacter stercoris TaxID=2126983 RepID=A0A2U3MXC7_9GAMM|nr:cysteine synthase family protein [Acinetobacter stercoris]SPL70024.1 Cysteine synthase [Acinetobacter stercoris]